MKVKIVYHLNDIDGSTRKEEIVENLVEAKEKVQEALKNGVDGVRISEDDEIFEGYYPPHSIIRVDYRQIEV